MLKTKYKYTNDEIFVHSFNFCTSSTSNYTLAPMLLQSVSDVTNADQINTSPFPFPQTAMTCTLGSCLLQKDAIHRYLYPTIAIIL